MIFVRVDFENVCKESMKRFPSLRNRASACGRKAGGVSASATGGSRIRRYPTQEL